MLHTWSKTGEDSAQGVPGWVLGFGFRLSEDDPSPEPDTQLPEPSTYRVRPGELVAPRSQYIDRSTTTG
jgi:hypothetical protein